MTRTSVVCPNGRRSSCRFSSRMLRALVIGLAASGLALMSVSGAAVAVTPDGHTIASAGTLSLGKVNSGGGGAVDFWKVQLLGGDRVQISAQTPNIPCCNRSYYFDLLPPGTTDASFPQTSPVMGVSTPSNSAKSVLVLQAPHTGTFILAVCENVSGNGDCRFTAGGGGDNPMGSYTFTPTLINGGVKASVGAKETQASGTIAKASLMPVGNFEAGGGGAVDFWKVHLLGGDRVQISAQTPNIPCCNRSYYFDLFPPGTTGTSFPQTSPVMAVATPSNSAKSVLVLQAPHTGTFLLAVCENVSGIGDCRFTASGGGDNPMGPYTFTPTLINGGVKAKVAARETQASGTIAKAGLMPVGNFEAGGGGAIDFWKVHLLGGDRVQISAQTPNIPCCNRSYYFDLFPPGTTGTSFPQTSPVVAVSTPSNSAKSVLVLKAPHTGTFLLAVCENVSGNGDCRFTASGGGDNPMGPYTFTTALTGGHETRTTLKLSASTISRGHEKKLRLSAEVAAVFSGHPAGRVTIRAGKKVVCSLVLSKGKGSCSPRSNTLLATGTYSLTAFYAGGKGSFASKSAARTLKVKK